MNAMRLTLTSALNSAAVKSLASLFMESVAVFMAGRRNQRCENFRNRAQ
jgi:hypothetical protein